MEELFPISYTFVDIADDREVGNYGNLPLHVKNKPLSLYSKIIINLWHRLHPG